ncbi:hypothetical protein PFICI_01289 [Pestalotiopsis fici W106-1]|uniref:ABC transporter domain-containing protein n=1 Tax=Pestalotiopsis fici (strain W106-1 / CGMCC3.15140) TaxID=1229662 RepID=W3XQC2_PESFW|nr:uncharacterized protein PFICI_01289 [Pestalotiopsis fici W106-1]ETS87461.1 hypothetical protein PFICI_01289 [Pestalotiopsis fici W106-1]
MPPKTPFSSGSDTDQSGPTDSEEFPLTQSLRELHQRDVSAGYGSRALGVTWNNLTVKALSAEAAVNENVFSQFNLAARLRSRCQKLPTRTILHKSNGCVKPGEMLLVLGRPGSGCTTLLNILSNRRAGYTEILGDVHFGSMTSAEAQKYRANIVMNTEEEIFFPSLTVKQTMDFATRLKVPANLPEGTDAKTYASEMEDFLLQALGVSHTINTKVGNEYVRGVSGGERKRVSVMECLASRASVFCWDNSTRGLDATNAVAWAKAIRAMTDTYGLATVVTLYQAGNDIFNLFDKVLVLDLGRQIYYGPAQQARAFMEDLGFVCPRGANIADFLTAVTVPTERRIRPTFEQSFPRDAEAFEQRYQQSPIHKSMMLEQGYAQSEEAQLRTAEFCASAALERHSESSPTTADLLSQVLVAILRNYQIIAGDKATFAMRQGSTLVQALIAGSLYYNAPDNSSGLFLKAGALNWSVLYHSLTAMSEVIDSFAGRPVHLKHRGLAFNSPLSICIAQIFVDLPLNLLQITLWSLPVYFLVGLDSSASHFFTYWITLFITTLCCNSLFRLVGSCSQTFDGAAKYAGYIISIMAMYTGYQIPKTEMHPWFGWMYWLNPLAYAFESLMANEFHLKHIDCVSGNLIPSGEAYTNSEFQSCAGIKGAQQGFSYLTGDEYLKSLSYDHSHVWRNFGILCGLNVFYSIVTVAATINWRDNGSSANHTLIPRELVNHHQALSDDVEARSVDIKEKVSALPGDAGLVDNPIAGGQLERTTSKFTWNNLCYTIDTPAGPKVLLDQVEGWVKPGTLTALMGSSGAGKTTLLDVLAQRKVDGHISGSILIDGHPTALSFQRSTGYCEQLDVHEPYTTVREALEFSALLRQPHTISSEDKLAYVNVVIDLLELHDIADTLIGTPGNGPGLSIEQRKRVTIGVELVSKPKLLMFLDEPTSGLDGQAAYNIVRFLRRLADAGQAVLVTIHQPSAQLFTQFDRLLLLARGGKTVYFGDIGDNAETVTGYFAKHGAPCPHDANPAEHMIDVVSGHFSDVDWNNIWLKSSEHDRVVEELQVMTQPLPISTELNTDDQEFATPLLFQIRVVLRRMNIALYRNTPYINNKVALHIGLALFNGFTYWQVGDTVQDIQLRLFTVFVWMFVASGVVNQLQPLFIQRRDIYDAREKKSRIYSWKALVTALVLSEAPYLLFCGVLYFLCWYYVVGFPAESRTAGATCFVVIIYGFLYTGIGQFIAAYAPNAVFAALLNPLIVGTMISFCGILVPYGQIVAFWKYWLYYLNPVTYLVGSVLTFTIYDVTVKCSASEFAIFDPPDNATCGQYLAPYLESAGSNLINPESTGLRSWMDSCKHRFVVYLEFLRFGLRYGEAEDKSLKEIGYVIDGRKFTVVSLGIGKWLLGTSALHGPAGATAFFCLV